MIHLYQQATYYKYKLELESPSSKGRGKKQDGKVLTSIELCITWSRNSKRSTSDKLTPKMQGTCMLSCKTFKDIKVYQNTRYLEIEP